MADFRNLKPGQMAKALNSFEEYGEVTDKGRTKANLDALGSRVQGESVQTIHGYKYAAWLFDQVSKSRPRGESGRTYEEIKAAAARRAAAEVTFCYRLSFGREPEGWKSNQTVYYMNRLEL